MRGCAPYPITVAKVRGGGAVLKVECYRSVSQYLKTMKKGHVMRGHNWSQRLIAELKNCIFNFARGLGLAKQADAVSGGSSKGTDGVA